MPKEIEKRKNAYQVNVDERDKLKRMYDQSLNRRIPNSVSAKAADDMEKVDIFSCSLRLNTIRKWIRSNSWH
jgi:hypothetical protein